MVATPNLVIGANEAIHFAWSQAKNHCRVSCQISVKQKMKLELAQFFGVKQRDRTIWLNDNFATLIKKLVLEIFLGKGASARTGEWLRLKAPPYKASYKDFEIGAQYKCAWGNLVDLILIQGSTKGLPWHTQWQIILLTGFVHNAVLGNYLIEHPASKECEN